MDVKHSPKQSAIVFIVLRSGKQGHCQDLLLAGIDLGSQYGDFLSRVSNKDKMHIGAFWRQLLTVCWVSRDTVISGPCYVYALTHYTSSVVMNVCLLILIDHTHSSYKLRTSLPPTLPVSQAIIMKTVSVLFSDWLSQYISALTYSFIAN